MADHPNVTLIRAALDKLGGGDMSALADVIADDVVWYEIGSPEPVRGKAALAARMTGGEMDFEITATSHDVVGNDEHVVALVNATATRGGRTLHYRTAEIFHVRDGQIVERWAFSDDTAAITAFFA
ncbi:MAG TPA: nuclear transport factor 2 family protein [Candidatus Limnocylindrales bacterium]|nr:nuclear transport factor 2 family protein [Candidatus Limnocylindrales bacterium]